MAPPSIVLPTPQTYDSLSDVQFRDIYGRNARHVAPQANILSKLYHHVSGNTANVSAAEVVSIDASNQGQWDLLLNTSARRLEANTITTQNTASWSANAMVTIRSANTTIRSANVIVAGNLTVSGDVNFDSPTFKLDAANNRLGIGTTAPQHALDVTGNSNISGVYRIAGQQVLSGNALGPLVTNSSLRTFGLINSLDVSGTITAGNLDVGGDINVSFPNVYRVGDTEVLSKSTLGPTVVNSSLTSFGTLTGLIVEGNARFSNKIFRSFWRSFTFPTNGVNICEITNTYGAYFLDLTLTRSTSGDSRVLKYQIPVYSNATGGEWFQAHPITTSGPDATDLLLQIEVTGSTTNLRMLMSGSERSAVSIDMILTQHEDDPLTITPSTSFGTFPAATGLYPSTLITQAASRQCVGIGLLEPNDNYYLDVLGSISAPRMVFAHKWRLNYNDATDSLDIERNTGTAASPTWVKTGVLAQM